MLQNGEKLPSTREMSYMMCVSRNSVLKAYEDLRDDGFIDIINNKGAYVLNVHIEPKDNWNLDWSSRLTRYTRVAEGFDILLTAITEPGDKVICENPTHNTAIKIMRLHKLSIIGVDM